MMKNAAVLSFSLMLLGVPRALDKKFVDLAYPFSAETPHGPTAKPFHLEKVNEGRTSCCESLHSYPKTAHSQHNSSTHLKAAN
jgi:hypothetical protein